MTTPESKVRDPVVRWAKANGFLHVRMSFRPGVSMGVPDDLFISPAGIHVWFEFKRPGKVPTPLQRNKLERLASRGVAAFWSSDAHEAIELLMGVAELGKRALEQAE